VLPDPYYQEDGTTLYAGDALATLRELPDESVHCIATSPPFYGLRDYGTGRWEGGDPECDHGSVRREHNPADKQATNQGSSRDPVGRDCRKCGARRIDHQIGLEETPDAWAAALVAVFREARRVLRKDGTLWVECGDSYAAGGRGPGGTEKQESNPGANLEPKKAPPGYKAKDLLGTPWLLALALRADGWWLRGCNIWAKPNAMPESAKDRCTTAHSYVFQLAKGQWKARVVALADLDGKRVHLSDHVGPKDASFWAHEFGVRHATAILDCPEIQQELTLPPLDAEVWKQRPGDRGGFGVAGLPVEHRATVYATRLLSANAPAKEFLCELDRLGVALTDGNHFVVVGGKTEIPLPPGVNRYGKTAVAIHDASEIGEIDFVAHTLKFSRASGCAYYFDGDAISEPAAWERWGDQTAPKHEGTETAAGWIGPRPKHELVALGGRTTNGPRRRTDKRRGFDNRLERADGLKHPRSVWTIPTRGYSGAHFATWPIALAERIILAGCPNNGTVLDPFAGACTTLVVAKRLGRHSIGIELNADYCAMGAERLATWWKDPPQARQADPAQTSLLDAT
jgi:DNA modification methylase